MLDEDGLVEVVTGVNSGVLKNVKPEATRIVHWIVGLDSCCMFEVCEVHCVLKKVTLQHSGGE